MVWLQAGYSDVISSRPAVSQLIFDNVKTSAFICNVRQTIETSYCVPIVPRQLIIIPLAQ